MQVLRDTAHARVLALVELVPYARSDEAHECARLLEALAQLRESLRCCGALANHAPLEGAPAVRSTVRGATHAKDRVLRKDGNSFPGRARSCEGHDGTRPVEANSVSSRTAIAGTVADAAGSKTSARNAGLRPRSPARLRKGLERHPCSSRSEETENSLRRCLT